MTEPTSSRTPLPRTLPPRTLASDLAAYAARSGEPVRLSGWVHRRRRLSELSFVVIRDRSGTAQVVVRDAATLAHVESLTEETTVDVVGVARVNAKAPGGVEVIDPVFLPLTEPAATPPVELWRPAVTASLPTMLDHAQLTWRHPLQVATWQLAAASMRGFRDTLDAKGYTEIQTPKLVASATEVGRERVRGRLLRPAGVPRPVATVLQADVRRHLRAGVRGRAGVSRRATRHRATSGRVRLPGRRARLHPRPSRRLVGPTRRPRRNGRVHNQQGSARGGVARRGRAQRA